MPPVMPHLRFFTTPRCSISCVAPRFYQYAYAYAAAGPMSRCLIMSRRICLIAFRRRQSPRCFTITLIVSYEYRYATAPYSQLSRLFSIGAVKLSRANINFTSRHAISSPTTQYSATESDWSFAGEISRLRRLRLRSRNSANVTFTSESTSVDDFQSIAREFR